MAAPASSRSTVSNTVQASPLGSYQSTNRLTSSTTAPRATSPVPASNRSRKTAVPPRESGSAPVKQTGAASGDAGSALAGRGALAAVDDRAGLRVHARAGRARGDANGELALGHAVARQHGLRAPRQPGGDAEAHPVRPGLHGRHAPDEPLRLAGGHRAERPR